MAVPSPRFVVPAVALCALTLSTPVAAQSAEESDRLACVVSQVYDGDTLTCADGTKVRLLLVDAPESQQAEWGKAAGNALTALAPVGSTVFLETDVQPQDRYGRLLAYVFLSDGKLVNEELARQGYVVPLTYPPNVRNVERVAAAVEEAKAAQRGLWATSAFECAPKDYRAGKCTATPAVTPSLVAEVVSAVVEAPGGTAPSDSATANADPDPTVVGPAASASAPPAIAPVADVHPIVGTPDEVTFELVSVVVGPSKAGGRKWDGFGTVNPAAASAVATALVGSNPYTGVLGAMASPMGDAASAPDVNGVVEVFIDDEEDTSLSKKIYERRADVRGNSFKPQFRDLVWKHLPLKDGMRIRLRLQDQDLSNHDDMGVVELTTLDLKAALAAGKVHPVQVADQSANQVLFVLISVRKSAQRTAQEQP